MLITSDDFVEDCIGIGGLANGNEQIGKVVCRGSTSSSSLHIQAGTIYPESW